VDPVNELLAAVLAHLRATTTVTSLVGTKIYDRVPEKLVAGAPVPNVTSPYISLGPVSDTSDDADCIEALEITFQIDAWSWGGNQAYGKTEVVNIIGAVRKALKGAELTLADNALVTLNHEITRILRDSDGVTNHGLVQFTAVIETP